MRVARCSAKLPFHPARRADLRCEKRERRPREHGVRAQEHEAMATHSFVNPMLLKKNSCQPSGHEQAIRVGRQEKLEQLVVSESARDSAIYFFSYLPKHELGEQPPPPPEPNQIVLSGNTMQQLSSLAYRHSLRHRHKVWPELVATHGACLWLASSGRRRPSPC